MSLPQAHTKKFGGSVTKEMIMNGLVLLEIDPMVKAVVYAQEKK